MQEKKKKKRVGGFFTENEKLIEKTCPEGSENLLTSHTLCPMRAHMPTICSNAK